MTGLLTSWMILIALGWLAWPLAAIVFPHASTRGYAYGRPLALVLLSWGFWLLNVLGLLSNDFAMLRLWVAVWVVLGLAAWGVMRRPLVCVLKQHWRRMLLGELLAMGMLLLLAVYKAHTPGILHTEQPMDYAFLNGCWMSPRLPPQDPWLSGHSISYYYLGYLIFAMLGRLAGSQPGAAYNAGLIITAAMTAHVAYALILDIDAICRESSVRHAFVALVGAVGATLAGNGEWLIEVLYSRGAFAPAAQQWLAIPGLSDAAVKGQWLPDGRWWWWRASRVIYDVNFLGRAPTVITEFPAFSLILGDLHPHVMALPYVLLAFAMGVSLYHAASDTFEWRSLRTVMLPLALGSLGMLNSWDLPTMLVFCWLAFAVGRWRHQESLIAWFRQVVTVGAWLATGAILPFLPFYRQLQSQASGLGLAYYVKTPLSHYLICTSPWIWILLGGAIEASISAWRKTGKRRRLGLRFLGTWLVVGAVPWLVTLMVGGWGRLVLGLGVAIAAGPWLVLIQSAMLAILAIELHWLVQSGASHCRMIACLTMLCGVGLTYLTEFFYVQDMFGTRMNTMFKVYYQAWAFLAIGAVLTLGRWIRSRGARRFGAVLGMALVLASLSYWGMAAYSKSEGLKNATWSLDGTAHLAETRPDEMAIIGWILENTAPDDVILIAVGQEFVPWTSRISAWTGRPTVLGWPGHEAQWRGEDALVIGRGQEINTAYTTDDSDERNAILAKYGVRYVVVGPNEKDAYGTRALVGISAKLEPVFVTGTIRLYAVRR